MSPLKLACAVFSLITLVIQASATEGGWSTWSETTCSVTCGGGSKSKSRTCNSLEGKGCTVGSSERWSSLCNDQRCEEDELEDEMKTALMDACKVDVERIEIAGRSSRRHDGVERCRSWVSDVKKNVNQYLRGSQSFGITPLMRAAARGWTEVCKILISAGADLDMASGHGKIGEGKTALILAAEHDWADTCEVLISAGADINKKIKEGYGKTALDIAIEKNNSRVVDVLERNGASVSDPEIGLAEILEFHGISLSDINKQDEVLRGFTPLMYATYIGHKDACKILVDAGADVNKENGNERGKTALLMAAEKGYTDICKMLISAGADIQKQDTNGRTALMKAVGSYTVGGGHSGGNTLVCKILISSGADVNKKTNSGVTALYLATEFGYTEIVEMLITAGAVVDVTGRKGMTPLMNAAFWGNTEICKLLVSAGADIDKEDNDGSTALRYAVMMVGSAPTIKFLISAGADVEKAAKEVYHSPQERLMTEHLKELAKQVNNQD